MGEHLTSEEGKALFCVRNNLTIRKGLMYVNITPNSKTEGLLAFVVPSAHRRTALNGVHRDAEHQGQHRMLALAEERFWWPRMVEDCWASVKGCQHCQMFKGAVVKAPLCPIKVYAPLELVHVDFTSIELTMELNQPPSVKECLGGNRPFHEIFHGICYQRSESQNCHVNTVWMIHLSIWCAH